MDTPGRELDAAVARKMGYTIYQTNVAPTGWGPWDGTSEDIYINDRLRNYGKTWLPRYSAPKFRSDHAALLECVLWLVQHTEGGLGLFSNGSEWIVGPSHFNMFECETVPGTDLAAFALAICRAIVHVK